MDLKIICLLSCVAIGLSSQRCFQSAWCPESEWNSDTCRRQSVDKSNQEFCLIQKDPSTDPPRFREISPDQSVKREDICFFYANGDSDQFFVCIGEECNKPGNAEPEDFLDCPTIEMLFTPTQTVYSVLTIRKKMDETDSANSVDQSDLPSSDSIDVSSSEDGTVILATSVGSQLTVDGMNTSDLTNLENNTSSGQLSNGSESDDEDSELLLVEIPIVMVLKDANGTFVNSTLEIVRFETEEENDCPADFSDLSANTLTSTYEQLDESCSPVRDEMDRLLSENCEDDIYKAWVCDDLRVDGAFQLCHLYLVDAESILDNKDEVESNKNASGFFAKIWESLESILDWFKF